MQAATLGRKIAAPIADVLSTGPKLKMVKTNLVPLLLERHLLLYIVSVPARDLNDDLARLDDLAPTAEAGMKL